MSLHKFQAEQIAQTHTEKKKALEKYYVIVVQLNN
jgi:hypothetical protein